MTPTLEVLRRHMPHPDPDRYDTVDLLRLKADDGWALTWLGQAELYEAGDEQSEQAMARMVETLEATRE